MLSWLKRLLQTVQDTLQKPGPQTLTDSLTRMTISQCVRVLKLLLSVHLHITPSVHFYSFSAIFCLCFISVIYLIYFFYIYYWFNKFGFSSKPPAQPEWLQVLSDSEIEISSELHWSCIAAGKPRPSIRWLRNGQPLSTQVTHTTCCLTALYTSTHKVTLKCFLQHCAVFFPLYFWLRKKNSVNVWCSSCRYPEKVHFLK